jgi:phosphoribosylglycinamide formyltransferase 1
MLAADLPIVLVLVDRRCGAIDIATEAGVPVAVVERTDFSKAFDRVAYTHDVVDALREHDVDLIAMAGFGTILEKPVHDAFPDRIVNTHPALLPAFKGWHAVPEALAVGVKVTGCTVHLARLEVDDGPILAQEAVPVLAGDTVERRSTSGSRRWSAASTPRCSAPWSTTTNAPPIRRTEGN